jgi:hypothetical protein
MPRPSKSKRPASRTKSRLDPDTLKRREVLRKLKAMTPKEVFELAVRAGIYTPDGELTAHYRDD